MRCKLIRFQVTVFRNTGLAFSAERRSDACSYRCGEISLRRGCLAPQMAGWKTGGHMQYVLYIKRQANGSPAFFMMLNSPPTFVIRTAGGDCTQTLTKSKHGQGEIGNIDCNQHDPLNSAEPLPNQCGDHRHSRNGETDRHIVGCAAGSHGQRAPGNQGTQWEDYRNVNDVGPQNVAHG